MAIQLVTGTGSTLSIPTQVGKAPAVAPAFAYSKDEPGESVYTNVNASLDQPNSLRFAASPVADMFKNTGLTPGSGQRKDGLSYLWQVNEVWKVNDGADTSVVPYYLPISAHVVLKFGYDALVTAAVLRDLVLRLLGAPCRNGTDAFDVALGPVLHGITRL